MAAERAGAGAGAAWGLVAGAAVQRLVSPAGGGGGAAAALADARVRWWPARGGAARTLRAGRVPVTGLALDPAGRRLAAAEPGRLRVWDLRSGAPLARLRVPGLLFAELAWAADGARVLVSAARRYGLGFDRAVLVWELESGRARRVARSRHGIIAVWPVASRPRLDLFAAALGREAVAAGDGTPARLLIARFAEPARPLHETELRAPLSTLLAARDLLVGLEPAAAVVFDWAGAALRRLAAPPGAGELVAGVGAWDGRALALLTSDEDWEHQRLLLWDTAPRDPRDWRPEGARPVESGQAGLCLPRPGVVGFPDGRPLPPDGPGVRDLLCFVPFSTRRARADRRRPLAAL